jgi:transcriptional regulator with XRE-family HTH domain
MAALEAATLPPPAERKQIRLDAGASLRDVGEALGVGAATAWKWEKGTVTPRLHHRKLYGTLLRRLKAAAAAREAA